MKQVAANPIVLSGVLLAAVMVLGAVWLAVMRSDGMVIDLAALAGLAICF
jgi:hypothetical protein